MNCLCIWLTGEHNIENSSKSKELECHFNLWMLNGIKHQKDIKLNNFLDIGIMLTRAEKSKYINIFIPDQVDPSNIQDLGHIFKDNTGLISAIFNEDYEISTRANEKTIEVKNGEMTPLFDIYMLDIANDISIEKQFGGSTIQIRIPEYLKNKKHYYRIRLKCAFVEQIGYVYTPPASSVLEGAFFETELIDFRVNEKRNLPSSLLETVNQNGNIHFTKTHFFLMREASDDYIFSHKPPGGRQLEKDIWKTYVGEDYSFKQITAYHWKEVAMHDSFNIFVKFRSFHSGFRMILITALVLIGLGIISNCLWHLLYLWFN
ncbi:MAG: hypothetical protein ACYDHZ_07930 [Dehalococcoidia bacterium]